MALAGFERHLSNRIVSLKEVTSFSCVCVHINPTIIFNIFLVFRFQKIELRVNRNLLQVDTGVFSYAFLTTYNYGHSHFIFSFLY